IQPSLSMTNASSTALISAFPAGAIGTITRTEMPARKSMGESSGSTSLQRLPTNPHQCEISDIRVLAPGLADSDLLLQVARTRKCRCHGPGRDVERRGLALSIVYHPPSASLVINKPRSILQLILCCVGG